MREKIDVARSLVEYHPSKFLILKTTSAELASPMLIDAAARVDQSDWAASVGRLRAIASSAWSWSCEYC